MNNYGFFIGATPDNVSDLQEAVGTPDSPLAIPGICGIKIFMGSSTGTLLVNERDALERIFNGTGGLIAVHAEDEKRMDERAVMIEVEPTWPLTLNGDDVTGAHRHPTGG